MSQGQSPELAAAATLALPRNQVYGPRVINSDGSRVFFDSFDPLVPRDVNGREDVYEWQAADSVADCEASGAELYVPSAAGCLSLISSGEGSGDSTFVDASSSGDDVFFATGQSLLPQDPGQIDVYDARVGGGFPSASKPTACEGESCQGRGPAPVPPQPATGSATAGNPPSKCRKGTHRVVKKGRARCVKKHAKKHKKGKGKKQRRGRSKSGGAAR